MDNILPFCNRHWKTSTNLCHHNEDFRSIKNLYNLTDESGNDDTNSLNVNNKYRVPEYFCNLQSNVKSIFHKSLNILSQYLFYIKKRRPTPCTSGRTWHRPWFYRNYWGTHLKDFFFSNKHSSTKLCYRIDTNWI